MTRLTIQKFALSCALIALASGCSQRVSRSSLALQQGSNETSGGAGSLPGALPVPAVTSTPVTSLPAAPALSNIRVVQNGNSATIEFDSFDGAKDYRIYALPANDGILLNSDGTTTVTNAVYRCAGTYQVPAPIYENSTAQSNGIITRVQSAVNGYTRSLPEAVLGYVYTTADAAPGLIPVYAMGNPDIRADDDYFFRYQASRDKKYTSSTAEYVQLLSAGWRDDGVAFYVPSQASASTVPISTNSVLDSSDPLYGVRYYLAPGAELSYRQSHRQASSDLGFSVAFQALSAPAPSARPLMRVYYEAFGGHSHDELAVGQNDFDHVRLQGLGNAIPRLHLSGISGASTYVVEALDQGCPFQGFVASQSAPAESFAFNGFTIAHPAWVTIADLHQSSPTGEVYVNGQFDGASRAPKAIARSFITLSPVARETMDWASTPESFSESTTQLACGAPDGNCFQQFRLQSASYDYSFYSTETRHWQLGNVLGELLVNYADWAADTNGKFRMTVRNQKATIASGSFAHATMEVNSLSSGRRYPQLILSDQDFPVQYNLVHGRSLILQTFGDFPSRVDLEVCDHTTWDVNQQCPRFIFRHRFDAANGSIQSINPIAEEDAFLASVDGSTRFDLYVSTTRAYIYVNSRPYGCANLASPTGVSPAPVGPSGAVSVTFGDALYHSGADDNFMVRMPSGYINRHQLNETSRHFDNLGFSSGVAEPDWDQNRIPCTSVMTRLDYDPGI